MKDSAILRFLIAFTAVWTTGIIFLNMIGPEYQINAVDKFTIFAQFVQRSRGPTQPASTAQERTQASDVDMSATASIPKPGRAPAASANMYGTDTQRPLTSFQLIYVTGDRVIIQSGAQMIEARIGQNIPGAGRILDIKRRGKNWMVVTNAGTIYEKTN